MTLQGVYTAIITPFSAGKINYDQLKMLLEKQIASGIAGVVPVGTSGESPTLSMKEHTEVIHFVCEVVNKRIQVIGGSGANSTEEAILLTKEAKLAGADATLQVMPYYNKPSQEGLYRHISAIAEKCELPILLYNIPGRTGISLEVSTLERLVNAFPIAGIKEAAGSVERVSLIRQSCPSLPILCGDDSLTVPMMSVGAKGVVSVASNIIPKEISLMVQAMLEGRLFDALTIHQQWYSLFKNLFIETNPVPIKAALAEMGWIDEEYRLPLCNMSEKNRTVLIDTMKQTGLLKK